MSMGLPFLMLLAAAQTPPPTPPREPAPVEAVSVTGTGRVTLRPDRATFNAGVSTAAPTAAAAVEENSRLMAAILAALEKAGAAKDDLRTAYLSVFPEMDHQPGRQPRVTGYRVTNSVTVTRNDVTGLPRLLQAAIDAGANQVSGISFVVADPTRGRQEGLTAAFADARAKAQILAQAAGRGLGRALSITEGGAVVPPPVAFRGRAMEMAAAAPDMPVEPGTEDLQFTISVTFELR